MSLSRFFGVIGCAVAFAVVSLLLDSERIIGAGNTVRSVTDTTKQPSNDTSLSNAFLFEQKEEALDSLLPYQKESHQRDIVEKRDIIMERDWNTAPIVIREYNLLFFTVPKVACTVFKKLFRRMMGYKKWRKKGDEAVHNPRTNGLEYLFHVSLSEAEEMMTSPNWTRAIFLRDPKERLLSAYLDKSTDDFIAYRCCLSADSGLENEEERQVCLKQISTFPGFVKRASICQNEHWRPYAKRIDKRHWRYINFFGSFDNLATDTKRLLRALGDDVWDKYGKKGWGGNRNESIFHAPAALHITNATSNYSKYYTPALEKKVELMYRADYKMFNFTKA